MRPLAEVDDNGLTICLTDKGNRVSGPQWDNIFKMQVDLYISHHQKVQPVWTSRPQAESFNTRSSCVSDPESIPAQPLTSGLFNMTSIEPKLRRDSHVPAKAGNGGYTLNGNTRMNSGQGMESSLRPPLGMPSQGQIKASQPDYRKERRTDSKHVRVSTPKSSNSRHMSSSSHQTSIPAQSE